MNTNEKKEDDESGDVGKHSTEWDLKRTEQFMRRHDVRRPSETQDIRHSKQDFRNDQRITRKPRKATYQHTRQIQ